MGDDLDDFDLEAVFSGGEEDGDKDLGKDRMVVHPSRMRKEPDQSEALEDDAIPKKKRKTAKAEGGEASQGPSQSKIEQRRKGKISLKEKFKQKDEAEDNKVTGNAEAQFQYVWDKFLDDKGKLLSELELEPLTFEADSFADPPPQFLHKARELPSLRPFIKTLVPDWASVFSKKGAGSGRAGKVPGSPAVIVVCASGMEAANAFKELKEFNSLCRIAKLFAKHFKIEEQEAFLRKEQARIVVGTPNRLEKLIDTGALKTDQLRLVVVDARRDAKGQNVFRMKDQRADLFALCQQHLFPLMHDKKIKMALF